MKEEKNITSEANQKKQHMNRREALKKGCKYAALTSASLFFVLKPKAKANVSAAGRPANWNPEEWKTETEPAGKPKNWGFGE